MSTDSDIFCPPEAVEIAWREKWRKYDSEDAAIRALRRKVKGIEKDKARSSLNAASKLLDGAISILKFRILELSEIYERNREITHNDLEKYMPLIEEEFKGYAEETRRTALCTAMVYHMR
ncbi:MAG: hypothetical protein AB3N10_11150 [Allomuricauda sp.]